MIRTRPNLLLIVDKSGRLQQRAKAKWQALLAELRKLTQDIEQIDRQLAEWQAEKLALDAQFADPGFKTETAQGAGAVAPARLKRGSGSGQTFPRRPAAPRRSPIAVGSVACA